MESKIIYLEKNSNIEKLLELGMKKRKFIYTNKLRGIGKTTSLIKFAKKHNLGVLLCSNSICRDEIKEYCYKNIFIDNGENFNSLKDKSVKGFVIDEGYKKSDITVLMTCFNIVTGFINDEHIFDEDKLDQIYSNIQTIKILEINKTKLLQRIYISQNSNNQSDYKMLINNLIKTIEAINLIKSLNVPSYQLNIKTDIDAKALGEEMKEYIINKLNSSHD